jgi:DNA-binding MarR family transcriptional regulator
LTAGIRFIRLAGTICYLVAFAHLAEPTNPMDPTRALLNRIPGLRHTCDLDLLMFFARHPRALIASERLAELIGYQLSDIARSLDLLLDEGLLRRIQNPTRAARLYVLATDGAHHAWLAAFVELGSTRQGRLALRRALIQCPHDRPTDRPTTERTNHRAAVSSRTGDDASGAVRHSHETGSG